MNVGGSNFLYVGHNYLFADLWPLHSNYMFLVFVSFQNPIDFFSVEKYVLVKIYLYYYELIKHNVKVMIIIHTPSITIPAILSFILADFTVWNVMSTALYSVIIWNTVFTPSDQWEFFLKNKQQKIFNKFFFNIQSKLTPDTRSHSISSRLERLLKIS